MIRLANLLQAPTISIYQLVKTKTFALYLFDMVKWIEWNENDMKKWNEMIFKWFYLTDLSTFKVTELSNSDF